MSQTHQYVAKVHMGTPLAETKLVLDINGPFLWLDCAHHTTLSSSQHSIPCSSLQCSMANASNGCVTASKVDDENKICSLRPKNTIKKFEASGGLVEDALAVKFRDGSHTGAFVNVHHFLFSCAPNLLLEGLASGVKGMFGFGNTRISLASQLSTRFGFERKFAICLSSSNGVILAGDGPYASSSGTVMDSVGLIGQSSDTHGFPTHNPSGMDISKSLRYTPLLSYQGGISEEYYINVKSIKINGMKLSVNSSLLSLDEEGNQGTKISTIVPYTTMGSTIYEAFVKAYIEAAGGMNMAMVEPVAPFDVCFSLDGLQHTIRGPNVPSIDLVLQSEMVKWRIHGRNSMVQVSDGIMCLGFFNGGLDQKASIIIGGHQLEENLLEFNSGTSMLGFASLLLGQKSCSDFGIDSLPLD